MWLLRRKVKFELTHISEIIPSLITNYEFFRIIWDLSFKKLNDLFKNNNLL